MDSACTGKKIEDICAMLLRYTKVRLKLYPKCGIARALRSFFTINERMLFRA